MKRVKLGLAGRLAAHAIGLWIVASAGLRGETLGALLTTPGVDDPRLVSEANASTEITSYGTFKSHDLFVIAYYRETSPDRLDALSCETAEQNWKHKELGLAHFREETQLGDSRFVFPSVKLNPFLFRLSCGCERRDSIGERPAPTDLVMSTNKL